MPPGSLIEYARRPSVAAYMLRAAVPSTLRKPGPFPSIEVRWDRRRADRRPLDEFLELTGLGCIDGAVPLLFPHVLTFPLQMVVLTSPRFPLPIWRVLQVRNHLLQHEPVPAGAGLDLRARVSGQRILEKGRELDLHVAVRSEGRTLWESLSTYYYRGRFGSAEPASPLAEAPDLSQAAETVRWRSPSGGGLRFSGISGDYNGIHYWKTYARMLGFRAPFHHPHVLVGQCLARLPALPAERARAQRLDLWLKGPVYYGCEVGLFTRSDTRGEAFALRADGSDRPAILGRRAAVEAGSRLLDEEGRPAAA